MQTFPGGLMLQFLVFRILTLFEKFVFLKTIPLHIILKKLLRERSLTPYLSAALF